MQIYVLLLITLMVINILYWIKIGTSNPILFLYDILSHAYMVIFIILYWYPSFRVYASKLNIIPFVIIIGIDFYLTVFSNSLRETQIEEFSKKDLDIAQTVAIVISVPAYITSALTCLELLDVTF